MGNMIDQLLKLKLIFMQDHDHVITALKVHPKDYRKLTAYCRGLATYKAPCSKEATFFGMRIYIDLSVPVGYVRIVESK